MFRHRSERNEKSRRSGDDVDFTVVVDVAGSHGVGTRCKEIAARPRERNETLGLRRRCGQNESEYMKALSILLFILDSPGELDSLRRTHIACLQFLTEGGEIMMAEPAQVRSGTDNRHFNLARFAE